MYDDTQCTGWYRSVIDKVMSINKHTSKIIWEEGCLGDMDDRVSIHYILPSKWNPEPKFARDDGWRQHLNEYSIK